MNMITGEAARRRLIGAGLGLLGASGLPRLAAPMTSGLGAILMFHHVRPWAGGAFAPNRGLEITPEFLDATIGMLRDRDFDIVSIDAALRRLQAARAGQRRFAVLTFDDGYRDNLEHALPALRRQAAPFTLYATTGFAEQTARLWWVELEEAIRVLPRVELVIGGAPVSLAAGTDAEKSAAFARVYWLLRGRWEHELLAATGELADRAGLDRLSFARNLCMDWKELAEFAGEPLCTLGVHTLTHPMLAKHPLETARAELAESRRVIEARFGRPATHLAYPVGDPTSAGPREFELARELGFASAVTTRKGMLFPEHAGHLTALPRLSINGGFQTRAALDVLLSGAPFWIANRGRRLDVA